MENSTKYLRSPLVYFGGKYKILDWLIPLFPKKCDIFIDVFGGSGVVSLNYHGQQRTIYNEKDPVPNGILNSIQEIYPFDRNRLLQLWCDEYHLYNMDLKSPQAKLNFLKFKEDFNAGRIAHENTAEWYLAIYLIHAMALNGKVEFNLKGKLNASWGIKQFTEYKRKLLDQWYMQMQNVEFHQSDFRNLSYDDLTENSFCYFDPPYITTRGSYHEKWTEKEQKDLFQLLDSLTKRNIKWGLSNVWIHEGVDNIELQQWAQTNGYYIHCKEHHYTPFFKNRAECNSVEVYICNYEQE